MSMIVQDFPPQIKQGIDNLVSEGWFKNEDEFLEEAVRRYLESHPTELMKKFIVDDVQWGLQGEE